MKPFNVPGHAHQVPFALRCFKTTKHEPVKPHNRLDDAKNRFYRTFADGIQSLARCCFEPVLHLRNGIGSVGHRRGFAKPVKRRLVMLLPVRSNTGRHLAADAGLYIFFTEKPVVGNDVRYRSQLLRQ